MSERPVSRWHAGQDRTYARDLVPFWDDEQIADVLTGRGADPLLRSYLWAFPAGIDWFVNLADSGTGPKDVILRAAYREPLSRQDLSTTSPVRPEQRVVYRPWCDAYATPLLSAAPGGTATGNEVVRMSTVERTTSSLLTLVVLLSLRTAQPAVSSGRP